MLIAYSGYHSTGFPQLSCACVLHCCGHCRHDVGGTRPPHKTFPPKEKFLIEPRYTCRGRRCSHILNISPVSDCCNVSPVADIPSSVYWRTPFKSLCNHRQLTEFYVLHIKKATPPDSRGSTANVSEKVGIKSCDVSCYTYHFLHIVCVRCSVCCVMCGWCLCVSWRRVISRFTINHGHLLHTGDTVWG